MANLSGRAGRLKELIKREFELSGRHPTIPAVAVRLDVFTSEDWLASSRQREAIDQLHRCLSWRIDVLTRVGSVRTFWSRGTRADVEAWVSQSFRDPFVITVVPDQFRSSPMGDKHA